MQEEEIWMVGIISIRHQQMGAPDTRLHKLFQSHISRLIKDMVVIITYTTYRFFPIRPRPSLSLLVCAFEREGIGMCLCEEVFCEGDTVDVRVRQDAGQLHFASDPPQRRPRHAYLPRWHFDMLGDTNRNDAYQTAIKNAVGTWSPTLHSTCVATSRTHSVHPLSSECSSCRTFSGFSGFCHRNVPQASCLEHWNSSF